MWDSLLENCSRDRLEKYLGKVAEDQLAAEFLYVANQKVSESLYPLISILEVSLRNRVHTKLTEKFGAVDWWNHDELNIQAFTSCNDKIERAKSKIYHRTSAITNKHNIKASQLVAEVSLNFWTSLFSEDLSKVLWSDLMTCFPHLPKEARKRRSVAKPLENIKSLRNRVMHHEPILFDESALPSTLHSKGSDLLSWMSVEMASWLTKRDRFQTVWEEYQVVLMQMHIWLECRVKVKAARESRNAQALQASYDAVKREKLKFDELANKYLCNT